MEKPFALGNKVNLQKIYYKNYISPILNAENLIKSNLKGNIFKNLLEASQSAFHLHNKPFGNYLDS